MLPVSAGSNMPTVAAAAATAAGPTEPSMWTLPAVPTQYRPASTIQAPLQFMSRVNLPGGGIEFQPGRAVPMGSMVLQQPAAASQHLGLGINETNLGMLAALNAFNRSGLSMSSEHHQTLEQHQQQQAHSHQRQQQQQQQQGTESGDDHQTSSQ